MTALPPPGPTEHLSRRNAVRAAFTERLGLKATAILIAILLWLIVRARQPTEGYVRVYVNPVLDSTLVLLDAPPQLQALVAGRAMDIVKLYADPPAVHRRIDGDAPDTLVLDVTPADVRLPAEFTNDIRILDVQPRSVTLRFGTRATRRVPVSSGGRILVKGATSLSAAEHVEFEPTMVFITGPRRVVRRIDSVHPFSLSIVAGDTVRHVADLDTTSLGVRVLPSQVKVMVRGAPIP
jgi:hypothetical protein